MSNPNELSLSETLEQFYRSLERNGLIDEQLRNGGDHVHRAVHQFIDNWPEDNRYLPGTAPAQGALAEYHPGPDLIEDGHQPPTPEDYLKRAQLAQDEYDNLAERGPNRRTVHELDYGVKAENYALLSIAGTAREILAELRDMNNPFLDQKSD